MPFGRPEGRRLAALLVDLGRRDINQLHIEAGQRLNGSFIREGLVDEFVIYLAPKLIGQGGDMASFGPYGPCPRWFRLRFLSPQTIGPDLRIVARAPGGTCSRRFFRACAQEQRQSLRK